MSSTSFVWIFGCRYQNTHEIGGNMPRIKDGTRWPNWPGRPTQAWVGRPRSGSPDLLPGSADPGPGRPATHSCPNATSLIHIPKKHMCTQIQPQDKASNVSKGQKTTKSRINDIINPREEPWNLSKADTWVAWPCPRSPTFLRRQFPRAPTAVTVNRHGDTRSSRWRAKAVDRRVTRPRARSADLPPWSADHRPWPPTDLCHLQVPPSHLLDYK